MATGNHGQMITKDGDRLGFFCGDSCPLAYESLKSSVSGAERVRILREKRWSGRTEIAFMSESRPRLYSLVVTYSTS